MNMSPFLFPAVKEESKGSYPCNCRWHTFLHPKTGHGQIGTGGMGPSVRIGGRSCETALNIVNGPGVRLVYWHLHGEPLLGPSGWSGLSGWPCRKTFTSKHSNTRGDLSCRQNPLKSIASSVSATRSLLVIDHAWPVGRNCETAIWFVRFIDY